MAHDLGPADARVGAAGLVLAPGIVDIHTHRDAQLTWDPFATPSTSLGVTTVVIGNCGFTLDERGLIRNCRRPGRLLRDVAA
jgi:N-acyl-D-aspartate/D-glutamate deacylase